MQCFRNDTDNDGKHWPNQYCLIIVENHLLKPLQISPPTLKIKLTNKVVVLKCDLELRKIRFELTIRHQFQNKILHQKKKIKNIFDYLAESAKHF
jgi:hypothetical protein